MPMRINRRISEFGGDPCLKTLGDEVFQALGLLMHFFERVVEHLIKKCLDQSVVAHHFQSPPLACGGEQYAMMTLIFDKRRQARSQFLQHVRD